MTELLYQTDSYLKEFDARISGVEVAARALILDRSAFYPGGGGQPYDVGSLQVGDMTLPVLHLKKQGDDVLHFVGGEDPLPPLKTPVTGRVDWERRHKLMRTHTA